MITLREWRALRLDTLRFVFALLIAASLLWHPDTSGSAAESVTMSVRPGFDGLARVGTWLPVELQVANRGPDITGELEIQVEATNDHGTYNSPAVIHSAPAVLPRYSDKRFVLEVYVPTVANHVSARLVSKGEVLVQRDLPLETVPSGELLCGVLSRNSAAMDFLPTIALTARQRNVRLAHLELSELPFRAQALSALDCLIFSNLATGTVSNDQMSAIQSWVSTGGLLIVVGGQNWQKTAANLPPDLLPVKIAGTVPVQSLTGLAQFAGQPIGESGPWLASEATVTDGTAIVREGSLPLLAVAKRGAGAVFYMALDPAMEPLRSWAGSEFLWRYVLSNASAAAPSPSVAARQYSGWGRVPRDALGDLSGAQSPTGTTLAIILFSYFLVLVPVSYVVLRKWRRMDVSIAIAALMIGAAGLASFAWANNNRTPDVIINKISVIRAWDATSPAYAHTYVSLFSTRTLTYDIVTAHDAMVQSLYYPFPQEITTSDIQSSWLLRVAEEERPTVRGYAVPQGSIGTFVVDSQIDAIPLSSDLVISDRHISGEVINRSDKVLQDAALIVGRQVAMLGTLGPGKGRAVDFDLSDNVPVTYLDNSSVLRDLLPSENDPTAEKASTEQDIAEAALNASYAYYARVDVSAVSIVAWLSQTTLPMAVQGAKTTQLDRSMLVATLPFRFSSGSEYRIPTPLIERRPMSVSAGSKLQSSNLILTAGESVATEFSLPVNRDHFDVNYLALAVDGTFSDQSQVAPGELLGSAAIFDWQTADWAEVGLGLGENKLSDPERFISPLGSVRVRYTYRPAGNSNNSRFNVSKFDLITGGRAL